MLPLWSSGASKFAVWVSSANFDTFHCTPSVLPFTCLISTSLPVDARRIQSFHAGAMTARRAPETLSVSCERPATLSLYWEGPPFTGKEPLGGNADNPFVVMYACV